MWPDERDIDLNGREIPWYEQLSTITENTVLFEVWARDVPDSRRDFPQGSTVEHIANIVLESDLIQSDFGDRRLFF